MDISVLGPFNVRLAGKDRTPSAPKLRRVLALLAVRANSVVSTEQLIEELWDENPPYSAATTLQTYIYQLRKMYGLGHCPEAASESPPKLLTSHDGYTLAIDPGGLDSNQFVTLAEQGRAQAEAGELESAAALFRDALKVWRGRVLGDVGVGPVLYAVAVWLDELRKSTLEQRIDLDLKLGRHHQLLSELTAIVAAEPTHERFQAQLMLTLYRLGRRSDALRAYRSAREALADELGLEPASELEWIHHGILTGDPALKGPSLARDLVTLTSPPTVPDLLPQAIGRLVERSEQCAAVEHALTARERAEPVLVQITGGPGTGKSAFCHFIADRLRNQFSDGQLYGDMSTGIHNMTATFLRATGAAEGIPDSVDERIKILREWLRKRSILVVLDNVTHIDEVARILPPGAGGATIFASGRRLSDRRISLTLTMSPLSRDGAVRMLSDLVGAQRVMQDENGVEKITELCDGVPSALHSAATTIDVRPHWTFGRLAEQLQRLDPARSREDGRASLYHSVLRVYKNMPESTQRAFLALARSAEPLSACDAAARLGTDDVNAEAILEDLVEYQIAEVTVGEDDEGGPFSYRFRRPFVHIARHLPAD